MSVTFTIEALPTRAFQFTCYATGESVTHRLRATSYNEAVVEADSHTAACEQCGTYGTFVNAVMDVDSKLDVNLANTNAVRFLGVLGYGVDPSDLVGAATGEDFLGRVLVALADDVDDSAVADVRTRTQGGATFIECGNRAGYRTETLTRLHALASEAVRLGRDIHWA